MGARSEGGKHGPTEAGSERLFSYAGLIMQPERSCLSTKTYERLVLSKVNLNSVYVHPQDVADEFEARRKNGWEKEQEEERHDSLFIEAELEMAQQAGDNRDK